MVDGETPKGSTYQLVSNHLYASGAVDKHGMADAWIDTATEAERATLFSDIATALIGGQS